MTQRVFGIHTGADYPRANIEDLLSVSQVVKCSLLYSDKSIYMDWHDRYPGRTFVGRDIETDIERHELHTRYARASLGDAYALGQWFADHITVNCGGLEFMHWESGPNEVNDLTAKWPRYCLGFGERMCYYRLNWLAGGWSYGKPPIPPLDVEDPWVLWRDVFSLIDRYNRGANGAALVNPRAGLYFHEGAMFRSMQRSAPYTVGRFDILYQRHIKALALWIPMIATEFAYGTDNPEWGRPRELQDMLDQIVWVNNYLNQFPYFMGYAWYDWRAVSSGTADDYMFAVKDLVQKLQAQHYTPRVLVPPESSGPQPAPSPESPHVKAGVQLFVRIGPSTTYPAIALLQPLTPLKVIGAIGPWLKISLNEAKAKVVGIDGKTLSVPWLGDTYVHGDHVEGGVTW